MRSSTHKYLSRFLKDRTTEQREQYQDQLDESWEDGIQWADGAIDKLREYNADAEERRPWTAE